MESKDISVANLRAASLRQRMFSPQQKSKK